MGCSLNLPPSPPPPDRRDTVGVPSLPPPAPPPPTEEEVHARLNSVGPSFAAPPPPPESPPVVPESAEEPSVAPAGQTSGADVVPPDGTSASAPGPPPPSSLLPPPEQDAKRAAATAGIAAMLAAGPPGAVPGSRPVTRPKSKPPPPPRQEPEEPTLASTPDQAAAVAIAKVLRGPEATQAAVSSSTSSETSEADTQQSGENRHRASTVAASTPPPPSSGQPLWIDDAPPAAKPTDRILPSKPPPPPPTFGTGAAGGEKSRPARLPPPPPEVPCEVSTAVTPTPAGDSTVAGAGASSADPAVLSSEPPKNSTDLTFRVQRDVGESLGLAIAGGAFRKKTSFGFGGAASVSSDIGGAHECTDGGWVGIYIRTVHPGGAAAACGMFVEGDRVLEVNGTSVRDTPHAEVITLLKKAIGMIQFTVSRDHGPNGGTSSNLPGASALPPEHRPSESSDRMNTATKQRLLAMIGAGDDDDDFATRATTEVDSSDDEDGDPDGLNKKSVAAALPTRIYSPEDVRPMVGWMHKMGGGKKRWSSRKTWKKRFFRLQGSMLLYYKPEAVLPDESGPIPGETAKGYINLSSDTTVSRPTERRLILETPERAFVFVCPSKEEADAWAVALKDSLAVVIATSMEDLKDANKRRRGSARK